VIGEMTDTVGEPTY